MIVLHRWSWVVVWCALAILWVWVCGFEFMGLGLWVCVRGSSMWPGLRLGWWVLVGFENKVGGWWLRWVAVAEAWVLGLMGFACCGCHGSWVCGFCSLLYPPSLPLMVRLLSLKFSLVFCCCSCCCCCYCYGVDFWMDADCGGSVLAMGLGLLLNVDGLWWWWWLTGSRKQCTWPTDKHILVTILLVKEVVGLVHRQNPTWSFSIKMKRITQTQLKKRNPNAYLSFPYSSKL